MKESAQAAYSIVRSRAEALGIDPRLLRQVDLHIHVPAGAIPKDGPSAGVAILTSLVSLLSDRPCRADVAMTGEISLTGRVMPVGGIKEKVLAAQRAGIRQVVLPAENRKDQEDIPPEVLRSLEFAFVDRVEDALSIALEQAPGSRPAGRKRAASASRGTARRSGGPPAARRARPRRAATGKGGRSTSRRK
jgi:ATP-dependent Lon protease